MQKDQHEFWNRSDDQPKHPDSDEEEEQVGKKTDLYAEYDIDPETVMESNLVGCGGFTDEGEEDVCLYRDQVGAIYLTLLRNLRLP